MPRSVTRQQPLQCNRQESQLTVFQFGMINAPNVERSQVPREFGYRPHGLVRQGVYVGEGHELQATSVNEIMPG